MPVSDIRIKVGFPDHPKTKFLVRTCGHEAVTCLLRLWSFAAVYANRGDLGRMNDEQIELAAGWSGEAGILIKTLRDLHWIDGSVLHDWHEHNPWAFHAKERSERSRKAAKAKYNPHLRIDAKRMRNACATHAERTPPSPSPSPSPSPTPTPEKIKDKSIGAHTRTSLVFPKNEKITAAIKGWVEFRQKARAPVTQRALDQAMQKAERWCGADTDRICELFDYAVQRGWKGLFWPREWGVEPGVVDHGCDDPSPGDPGYVGPGAEAYHEYQA